MDLWHPPPGEVEPFAWWHPLLLVSRRVREARIPWPVHLDEFELCGRVDRRKQQDIWVYRHRRSQRLLLIDATGATYRYVPTPNGQSSGRFIASDLRTAVSAAGLPDNVEPVWYGPDRPPGRRHPAITSKMRAGAEIEDEAEDDEEEEDEEAEVRVVRRGHLRLVATGTNGLTVH